MQQQAAASSSSSSYSSNLQQQHCQFRKAVAETRERLSCIEEDGEVRAHTWRNLTGDRRWRSARCSSDGRYSRHEGCGNEVEKEVPIRRKTHARPKDAVRTNKPQITAAGKRPIRKFMRNVCGLPYETDRERSTVSPPPKTRTQEGSVVYQVSAYRPVSTDTCNC